VVDASYEGLKRYNISEIYEPSPPRGVKQDAKAKNEDLLEKIEETMDETANDVSTEANEEVSTEVMTEG
jgi:tRNA acetyltransferase TAN1